MPTEHAGAALSRLRLLQLVSPALPVGAFAYSQGMEYAVECGWIRDEREAQDWIAGLMEHAQCRLDLPVLARMLAAWCNADEVQVREWCALLQASREAAELLAEDRQLGAALARLLVDLGLPEAAPWRDDPQVTYVAMFALACARWEIAPREAATGYLWSWAENQVMAALKLVPLGQTAGQRILSALLQRMPQAVERALALADDDIGALAPAHAIACARHETQYSRLFRS